MALSIRNVPSFYLRRQPRRAARRGAAGELSVAERLTCIQNVRGKQRQPASVINSRLSIVHTVKNIRRSTDILCREYPVFQRNRFRVRLYP